MNIHEISHWGALGVGLLITAVLIYTCIIFLKEKERVAFSRSVILTIVLPTPFALAFFMQIQVLEIFLLSIFFLAIILFLFPFKTPLNILDFEPKERFDERDIMFSRKELVPGTEKYDNYYKRNPQNKAKDEVFRAEPGLLSENSRYYHQRAFTAAEASFSTVDLLHNYVGGKTNPQKTELKAKEITKFITNWAKEIGAIDIGVTMTKPYHFYSVKGRREDYDKPVEIKHKYAIAFTVEMTHEMVTPAPQASIIMESARQYIEAGRIAVQLAGYIRELGYDARAHIDGNYQVICPLVARDAGLGEIGRMGLLMTPGLGPRVRIGVVTTDLELELNDYKPNHTVADFCMKCKKCAECCPSQSIQFEEPSTIDGVKRWRIDSEACFTYWCKAGTDCGRCMAVCPYSHPDKGLHNFIRWGINRSRFFRILAVWLDDFFYGKKPKPHKLPTWL